LRISCRLTDWPTTLNAALQELFPGDAFKCLVMAPLQQSDVVLAAKTEGISAPEDFLRLIQEKHVAGLANRPITLKFLIRHFTEHGGLPASTTALFESGCRYLCSE